MSDPVNDIEFLQEAIGLAAAGVRDGIGGPFGCVIVKDGIVIGRGCNQVTSSNDPTAHAEVVAIRNACQHLGHYQLTDCDVFASCEPCPMCLGALYWARPRRILFASTRQDAAEAGFDDALIYKEIQLAPEDRKIPFTHRPLPAAVDLFTYWKEKGNKKLY